MRIALAMVGAIVVAFAGTLLAADFDGDGRDDIGIFRPADGLWAIRNITRAYLGNSTDTPVPGKYGSTTRAEIGIFRPSEGLWAIQNVTRIYFGQSSDIPMGGIGGAGGGESFWSANGSNIYFPDPTSGSERVGIGDSTPNNRLEVRDSDTPVRVTCSSTADHAILDLNSAEINAGEFSRLDWRSKNVAGNNKQFAAIDVYYTSKAAESEDAEMAFSVIDDGTMVEVMRLEGSGEVGIGTANPVYPLDVNWSEASFPIAQFFNLNSGSNADGIQIWLARPNPGTDNEFIKFIGGIAIVGRIEGTGAGGVTYASGAGDFAEWLPRLHAEENIEAGDVVGVIGGQVTRDTCNAEYAQVVSSSPAFLGNDPGQGQKIGHEKVALLGQVPIRVRGSVRSGDYIIPSGLNDGTGVARSPGSLNADQTCQVVGRARESAPAEGVKLVSATVGLNLIGDHLSEIVREKDSKISELASRLESLEKEVRELKAR